MANERKETTSQVEAEKLQNDGWNTVEVRGLGEERVYVLEKTGKEPVKEKPKEKGAQK
jgi:hypothetical protein